jgi:hypothetical protein
MGRGRGEAVCTSLENGLVSVGPLSKCDVRDLPRKIGAPFTKFARLSSSFPFALLPPEEKVDNHTADGEEDDEERPDQLVGDTTGLIAQQVEESENV